MLILFIIIWILMGFAALLPYCTQEELGQLRRGQKVATLIIFLVLGPLISIATIINLFIYYWFGGDGPPSDAI